MHALRAMHNTFVVAFAFLHRPSIYLTTSSCLSCRSLARCQKESSRRSFLVSSRQSRPRSNPVRRSCQILFSEIESNPIESNLGRKGITRVIYLHGIASQVKHRTDHQHDFAKKIKKFAPPPKIVRLYFWPPTMGNVSCEYTFHLRALFFPSFLSRIPYSSSHSIFNFERSLSRVYLIFQETAFDKTYFFSIFI